MKRILTGLILAGLIMACEKPTSKIEPTPNQEAQNPKAQNPKALNHVTVANLEPDIRPVPPLGPEGLKYEDALLARMAMKGYTGAAIAIVDGDTEEFMFHGPADPMTGSNVHMDSLFEIGSITKTFTALLLADMALKGEVGLDDPISDYLPDDVTIGVFENQPITLKHLATHMSGMPRMPFNFIPVDFNNPYADYREDSIYSFLNVYTPARAPGAKFEYSNLGAGLLGVLLARQADMSYEALVRARILEPLGMTNSYIEIPDAKAPDFAKGHNFEGKPAAYWDITGLAGAGALRSDIEDMAKYLRANLGLTETPLSEAMQLSHKLQYELGGKGNFMGLGWLTYTMGGQSVTWHNGGTGGFRTFIGFDKANGRGAVVLLNSAVDSDIIGRAIITENPDVMRPEKGDEENKDD